jgi:hypothetical protein
MERDSDFEREQEEAAANEAAEIGGEPGKALGYEDDPSSPGVREDPAFTPVDEAGGGQAEGFEQAEAQLIDRAENPRGPSPEADQAIRDDERVEPVYGEPDEVHTSEDEPGEPGRW